MISLGESDAGIAHTVQQTEDFLVALPENPTTGHRWHLTLPDDGLTLTDDGFTADPGHQVGSGGTRTFLLHAAHTGTHRILLANKRSWESAQAAAAQLEFTVDVLP